MSMPEPPIPPDLLKRALALAETMLPPSSRLPGANETTVRTALKVLSDWGGKEAKSLSRLLTAFDAAAFIAKRKRFAQLSPAEREDLLHRWEKRRWLGLPVLAASFLFKAAHFDTPEVYAALGATYAKGGPAEPARWLQQVRNAARLGPEEEAECDVVVIGTGAGGAVVGYELAARGYAVIFVEEGLLYRRDAFNGRVHDAHRRFYRDRGSIVAVGNCIIPVLMGRLVGGSTAINTGTCFRTPDWVLERWCEELGTDAFSPAAMRPHFEAVERQLQVAPSLTHVLGGPAKILARGCDVLGWHHFPLQRNAPACDGQAVCDFGCPSDARRSTNIAYIPPALNRGAVLFTGMKAERLLIEGGRTVGLIAKGDRGRVRLRVRARAVVLAGGAIPTPLFLLRQGICNGSGMVGRNLSLHPATVVSALFDEPVRSFEAAPQGYACDQFQREGILILGASAPPSLGAMLIALTGRPLMDVMDQYDSLASFGVMAHDEGRGRVRLLAGERKLITYRLTRGDVVRLHRGMSRLAEIYFAAGAKRVLPLLFKYPELRSRDQLKAFESIALKPWELFLTSFHPLGTCRMSADAKRGVVDFDHQAHELSGLFIVDGSTMPGPPGVNPQETIMAMAHRAAATIAERLA